MSASNAARRRMLSPVLYLSMALAALCLPSWQSRTLGQTDQIQLFPQAHYITGAMREIQIRYYYQYGTTIRWPDATDPRTGQKVPAPAFPPEGFYDADLEDPQTVAWLVNCVRSQFFQLYQHGPAGDFYRETSDTADNDTDPPGRRALNETRSPVDPATPTRFWPTLRTMLQYLAKTNYVATPAYQVAAPYETGNGSSSAQTYAVSGISQESPVGYEGAGASISSKEDAIEKMNADLKTHPLADPIAPYLYESEWSDSQISEAGSTWACGKTITCGQIQADLTDYPEPRPTAYYQKNFSFAEPLGPPPYPGGPVPTHSGSGFSWLSLPATNGEVWSSGRVHLDSNADHFSGTFPDCWWFEPYMPAMTDYHVFWMSGQMVMVKRDFKHLPDTVPPCPICPRLGSFTPATNSFQFRIDLGFSPDGRPAGYLYLYELPPQQFAHETVEYGAAQLQENADERVLSPMALGLAEPYSQGLSVTRNNGAIRRIVCPEGTVIVDNMGLGYCLKFYHGQFFEGEPGAAAFKIITVSRTDPGGLGFQGMQVTEDFADPASPQKVTFYRWDAANRTWSVTSGSDSHQRQETVTKEGDPLGKLYTETRTIRDPGTGATAYREVTSYEKTLLNWRPTGQVLGSDQESMTAYWRYYGQSDSIGEDDLRYGLVKEIHGANGRARNYTYDCAPPYDNISHQTISEDSKTTQIDYACSDLNSDSVPDTVVMITETAEGRITGTTVKVFMSPGLATRDRYIIDWNPDGTSADIGDILSASGHYGHRVTRIVQRHNPGMPDDGQVLQVFHPDGTMDMYGYGATTTVQSGRPAPDNGSIVDGTWTQTVTDGHGNLISLIKKSIRNGLEGSTIFSVIADPNDHDEFGRPKSFTYHDGTTAHLTYNCCGISSITDRDGVVTIFQQDPLGRTAAVVRPGICDNYTYDAAGRLLTVSRNDVLIRSLTYDAAGRLRFVGGNATHPLRYDYGWDTNGYYVQRIRQARQADNSLQDTGEWVRGYPDFAGRIVRVQYPDDAVGFFQYDGAGHVLLAQEPHAAQETNFVQILYRYCGSELQYAAIDMNHNGTIDFAGTDRIAKLTRDVVTRGNDWYRRTLVELYADDGSPVTDRVASTETSLDGLKSWQYRPGIDNATYTVFCPASGSSPAVYAVTNPDNTSTTVEYAPGDHVASVTERDGLGVQTARTSATYTAGLLTSLVETDGNANHSRMITFTAYDEARRPTALTVSANGVASQNYGCVYDPLGRILEIDGPAGSGDDGVVHYTYWPTGELQSTWGARTYPVNYAYDYAGRIETMTTWHGGQNNTLPVTTSWTYDPQRGWLTAKTYGGDTPGPSYRYTGAGRLKTRTWARGIVTTYGYNAAGDLSGLTYSDNATPGVAFTYDRRGREIQITDTISTHDLTYDAATGQADTETLSGMLYPSSVVLNNDYDIYGRRSRFQTTARPTADIDGSGTVGMEDLNILMGHWALSPATGLEGDINGDQVVDLRDFGAWKRQKAWPDSVALSIDYGYDADSRVVLVGNGTDNSMYGYQSNSDLIATVTTANGSGTVLTVSKAYDCLNRLTGITATRANGPAIGSSYAYNNANQRTSRTKADSTSWSYGYDALGQLISADKTGSPACQFDYTYDSIGNRLTAGAVGTFDNASFNYSPNLLNQYTTITKDNVSSDNLSYDFDGNLIGDGRWIYAYDGENRLIGMASQTDNLTLLFTYDYLGRRVLKEAQGTSSSTVRFIYDGWNMVAELDSSNGLVRSYTWGLDRFGSLQEAGGIGGLLAVCDNVTGQRYLPAYEGSGNVTGMVNANDGTVAEQYEYSPYGQLLPKAYALVPNFLFSTKYTDGETGLVYFGYRYYNPQTGRWLNRDPLGEAGGPNLYAFVGNDPVNWIDPLGLLGNDNWLPMGGLSGSTIPYWNGSMPPTPGPLSQEQLNELLGMLDRLQDLLSAGGTVEPTPFCDLTNALISLGRGRWSDAGILALGVIPYVGDTAKLGRFGSRLAKMAEATEVVTRIEKAETRFIPNPYGRLGGPLHREKISEIISFLKGKRFRDIRTEVYIATERGMKRGRFVDIAAMAPEGDRIMIQVGRTTAKELPVSRELEAIKDLQQAGHEVWFIPFGSGSQ